MQGNGEFRFMLERFAPMTGSRLDDSLRNKLVVLIGGSGFVGRHLAAELLARGAGPYFYLPKMESARGCGW